MTKSDPPRCRVLANIIIQDSRWEKAADEYSKLCSKIFTEMNQELDLDWEGELELSLKLTDDDELMDLNSSFRGKEKSTNVLSFPSQTLHKGDLSEFKESKQLYLGDVAISYDKVQIESNKYDIKFENHLAHLILHSILHLLGYDHVDDKDAFEMEGLEKKILKRMNIDDPYDLMVQDVR